MCVWAWLHPEGFFVKNHGENTNLGARSCKMRISLVWTLFLVRATSTDGQAVTGPKQVTVEQGSSLAVSCSYKPRYKLNSKYWCRKNFLRFCLTYIQTNGSEVTVTGDRVSIRDNHTAHAFTVTLSSVTLGDAGQYSCGVKRKLGINQWHSTKVMVSAAVSNTTEDGKASPVTTSPLCSRDCGELPVLSQLSVIHFLLLLSIKVPTALAVVCGAAWMRSRCGSCAQENPQLLEVSGSTRARGCPPVPTTSEPQGCPPAPPGPSLLGPCRPSQPPRAGRCSAPGASALGKPRPLLAAPALEREGVGVQRACVC
ncbi:CMRF35-like molecule 2 [Aphelocoma coerulescens]|uniref:CMRF35-like molecule 2 n=1 Tax=Aphelocoma coerulescens TaxID=39617 RepID=UPI003604534E